MLTLNFTPFPVLTTQRLILRQLVREDEEAIFALRSNEQVNRFLERTPAQSMEDARLFIQKINKGIQDNESLYWAITLREDGQLIGTMSLWNITAETDMAEIGYELLPPYQGKGFMQEAFSTVIEYGFGTLQLQTIEAWSRTDNAGSIKLLEKNHFTMKELPEPNMAVYILNIDLYQKL
jgi:ribosomal-protein-alanine N-acetyltransferase